MDRRTDDDDRRGLLVVWPLSAVMIVAVVLGSVGEQRGYLTRLVSRCTRVNGTAAMPASGHRSTFQHAAAFDVLAPRMLASDPWIVAFDAFASDEEVAILAANDEFYTAFSGKSVKAMEAVWAGCDEDSCPVMEEVFCSHPGYAFVTGRQNVLESFGDIFQTTPPMRVRCLVDSVRPGMAEPIANLP